LSYSVKNSNDEAYFSELFSIRSEQRLFNYEKKYLLSSLKEIIGYDRHDIWLKNRSKSGFVLLIRKMDDRTLYEDNKLFIDLLEFSNDLFNFRP
jgi:hypothetical protein